MHSTRLPSLRRLGASLAVVILSLLIASLACSLPVGGKPTPTATVPTQPPPTPTSTPRPLPPTLVQSDPPPGSEIPLYRAITFYFNQPMDRGSVEGAVSGQPTLSGQFNWLDDATMTFIPDAPFLPETDVNFQINTSAHSQRGLAMMSPVQIDYRTATYLRLSQVLPEVNAIDVLPTSAIVAAFNRPVVPLGGDPATFPAAFSIEPAAQGRTEWVNTSTFIFYPEPALAGGVTYTVRINQGLQSLDGSPLDANIGEIPYEWGFTTASPRLLSIEPADGSSGIGLDAPIRLTFNLPMDGDSLAANFSLNSQDGQPVKGVFGWSTDFNTAIFTPTNLLQRGTNYTLRVPEGTLSSGGTPLDTTTQTSFSTVPDLFLSSTTPIQGGQLGIYENIVLQFSADLPDTDILDYFTLQPEAENLQVYVDQGKTVYVYGNLSPETDYTLAVSAALTDRWGDALGKSFTLNFRSSPLPPSLFFTVGTDTFFLTPEDTALPAQVTNLGSLPLSSGSVPLEDFINMLGPQGYDLRQNYQTANQRSWQMPIETVPNQTQNIEIPITPDNSASQPGLYYLKVNTKPQVYYSLPLLLVVSNIQLTFKTSSQDALVWAVDLRTNAPVPDAPVTIYDQNGSPLAAGQTGADGVFTASFPTIDDPYTNLFAVMDQPGSDRFSLALSNWSPGISSWDFNIQSDYTRSGFKTYLYTDRPIYRPGQTVYFRAIGRQAFNGRYQLPEHNTLLLTIYDEMGMDLAHYELPLDAYGSGNGEYNLLPDATPGNYRLGNDLTSVWFQVAEYRKPEINLQVQLTPEQSLAGADLQALVNARYFFDAPVGNLAVHWTLYRKPDIFSLAGYQTGNLDTSWLDVFRYPASDPLFGTFVLEGDGITAADGTLAINLPTADAQDESSTNRQIFTLEVTGRDESGQPVSARATATVNPAEVYIGVQPEAWVSRAGTPSGFGIQVVDWNGNPAGERSLSAVFRQVSWVRQEPPSDSPYELPVYVPQYTPVASQDLNTDADGRARVQFTPPKPGTYQLDVSGNGAQTQVMLWVGGEGQVIWPNLPNQRLRLTADQESYQAGQTAQVFVPNEFGADAQALVTIERGVVMRHEVRSLDPSGSMLSIPLSEEDAPNVYLAVTVIGKDARGQPDFRQGYVTLNVAPVELTLQVALTSQPERSGPGETVQFGVRVTDASGNPVQGEFSLSVVDKAVLALADPNAPDILSAFYGTQPLGVRTGWGLAVYAYRKGLFVGGMGGGGGETGEPVVREQFPDTAFWKADIVTDPNGEAQVTMKLPDNLTTWQVDTRGLTADTRVGQATLDLVTTKDLLVRPVVPRFLVAGDHIQLGAIVQNNTPNDLQVSVALQASGVTLDDPAAAEQQVSVPAAGRAQVIWWAAVGGNASADLLLSARSNNAPDGVLYEDAVRPAGGQLPILSVTAPQAFATSGVLPEAGDRLEVISLPTGEGAGEADQTLSGELRLELSPSLAAAMLNGLDALEHFPYECTEQTLSRFLPNLEAYRALQSFGLESPELADRLDRTLNQGLKQLYSRQNLDGGWGWWAGSESDPLITAYVLFGLSQAKQAGIEIEPDRMQRAADFLMAGMTTPEMNPQSWQLDRLVFEYFALSEAGLGDISGSQPLYNSRESLSPWAQALLAITLEKLSPGEAASQTLLSNLQSTAIRSATGVHWEASETGLQNMSTPLSTSGMVVYALAQKDPASAILPEAIRYLMSNRQPSGAWNSTYETAWILLGINEYIKGSGELGSDFTFDATLNDAPIATGQASGDTQLTPVTAVVPASKLYPNDPNALLIQRQAGAGRLYYSAALQVEVPVAKVNAVNSGIQIWRSYFPALQSCQDGSCDPIEGAQVGDRILVRVSLTLPNDAYYLVVEDYIPAGAQILNTQLKTSLQSSPLEVDPYEQNPQASLPYSLQDPLANGWGWWNFHPAQIYDDHIAWAADYLPAGTYELTYTLEILQPGEFHVLPARAWQFYFPDVRGNSDGVVFNIQP